MKIELLEFGQVDDKKLKFAVIGAVFQNKWVFVKHNQRDTWEIPGGHREINEDIDDTAKRELYEETGAKVFEIKPISDYSVIRGDEASYGRLFHAVIKELGDLPDLEISEIELFDKLPEKLTYPKIQLFLYKQIVKALQNSE